MVCPLLGHNSVIERCKTKRQRSMTKPVDYLPPVTLSGSQDF